MNRNILEKDFKIFFKIKEISNKITASLPFRILVITLVSIGLYHYLFSYKDRTYGIDQLKYFLILDKNAKLKDMRCRRDAKYSFDIKTNPIKQEDLINMFLKAKWHKRNAFSIVYLSKNNVQMSMSMGEEYKTNTSVVLIWN